MTEKITNRISVSSKVTFTPVGGWGVVLFVGAPLSAALIALALPQAMAEAAVGSRDAIDQLRGIYAGLIGCGVASAAGLAMMLVRRHYDHEVAIRKPEQ